MIQKEIGGFFELELPHKDEYHTHVIRLNKARSALHYLLKTSRTKKIYLPHYMCHCILEPILALHINYEFYNIDEKFNPIFHQTVGEDEYFLYINYFGLCTENVKNVINNIKNVIVDNTQAFFEYPIEETPTIYSPRKFFGVPDGGYLYTKRISEDKLPKDSSYNRLQFLAKRIDSSANNSYTLYQKNEEILTDEAPKRMSNLTQRMLQSIDYEQVKKRRNENFHYIHNELKAINKLEWDTNNLNSPMVYPLFVRQENIKQLLISNNIYVATYWKEVLQYTKPHWFEHELTRYLVPLPIDQRYGTKEMHYIVQTVKNILS